MGRALFEAKIAGGDRRIHRQKIQLALPVPAGITPDRAVLHLLKSVPWRTKVEVEPVAAAQRKIVAAPSAVRSCVPLYFSAQFWLYRNLQNVHSALKLLPQLVGIPTNSGAATKSAVHDSSSHQSDTPYTPPWSASTEGHFFAYPTGSETARVLVGTSRAPPAPFLPLSRQRNYTRLLPFAPVFPEDISTAFSAPSAEANTNLI